MSRWLALSVLVLLSRSAAAADSMTVEVDVEQLKYRGCLHLAQTTEYDAIGLDRFRSGPTPWGACVQVKDDLGQQIRSVDGDAGHDAWCPSAFVSTLPVPAFVKPPQSGEVCGPWLDVAGTLAAFDENSKTIPTQWAKLKIVFWTAIRPAKTAEHITLKGESAWVSILPAARPRLQLRPNWRDEKSTPGRAK